MDRSTGSSGRLSRRVKKHIWNVRNTDAGEGTSCGCVLELQLVSSEHTPSFWCRFMDEVPPLPPAAHKNLQSFFSILRRTTNKTIWIILQSTTLILRIHFTVIRFSWHICLVNRAYEQGADLHVQSIRCIQPTVFFSHTKPAPATSQPAVFFSHNKSAPATAQRTEWFWYQWIQICLKSLPPKFTSEIFTAPRILPYILSKAKNIISIKSILGPFNY